MPRMTLIGYRGSGKSTVAALVASALGCDWHDADTEFERRTGGTIAAFIRDHGEPAFREAETSILDDLLRHCRGVLATGGGVVLRVANRERLRHDGRPVVWLRVTADVARARLAADPATADRRPALAGTDPLAEVAAAITSREPLYREVADLVVEVDGRSPEEAAGEILARMPTVMPQGVATRRERS
jgi:shikimate kinase